MKSPHCLSHNHPRQRSWLTGIGISFVISTLGWLPLSTLWQSGYAQNFTNEEIANYAAAVLAIENIRGRAYAEISDLMTSKQLDVTRYDLRCLSAHNIDLPRAVRSPVSYLLINYCNDAQKLVEDSGLTVQLFNSITVTHRQDEELKEQIQLEIARANQL